MAKRGPVAKPAAIVELEGNPGRRPLNGDEPAFQEGVLEAPFRLTGFARQVWERVVKECSQVGPGYVKPIDAYALAGFCSKYAEWAVLQRYLRGKGLTYVTATGFVRPRPEVKLAAEALSAWRLLAQDFGFTPGARARLRFVPERPEDLVDDFLVEAGIVV